MYNITGLRRPLNALIKIAYGFLSKHRSLRGESPRWRRLTLRLYFAALTAATSVSAAGPRAGSTRGQIIFLFISRCLVHSLSKLSGSTPIDREYTAAAKGSDTLLALPGGNRGADLQGKKSLVSRHQRPANMATPFCHQVRRGGDSDSNTPNILSLQTGDDG